MSILDPYGNPAYSTPSKFIHAADNSRFRGTQYMVQNKSLEELISSRDRDVIVSLCKRLYFNLGAVKSVVKQKAAYSVGEAYMPAYKGTRDKGAGEVVKRWLTNVFMPNCDVRGGQWDWLENLQSVSTEIDVSGDHFTLLTASEDGEFPKIQNIPAYAVRNKGKINMGRVVGGQWDGRKIVNGIIYNDQYRALAYRIESGKGCDDYLDIPAASIHHSYDPEMSDGLRGLPTATHALDDMKHILASTESERMRQQLVSNIGLMVQNDTGGPDLDDPTNFINSGSDSGVNRGMVAESVSPGIFYAKAGEGESITQMRHETGGDSFESFQDRMIRSFVVGADWSYSLVWKPTGQGTAERGEVMRARKAVLERQKRLDKWAKRVLTYAYSFMASRGNLPELLAPMSWSFSKPPRLTVDDGREAKMMLEQWRSGNLNQRELLEMQGMDFEEHLAERVDQVVKTKKAINQANDTNPDIYVDYRDIIMLTPNETPTDQTTLETDDE